MIVMGNLRDHAVRELELSGWAGPDGFYGDLIEKSVLQIVDVFEAQGHSGMSAPPVVRMLEKILMYEPLVPLTGEDDEWFVHDYSFDVYAQNIRCGHVFKRRDGSAYDSEGRVFRDLDGSSYIGKDSRVDIEFPYTPKVEYVHG